MRVSPSSRQASSTQIREAKQLEWKTLQACASCLRLEDELASSMVTVADGGITSQRSEHPLKGVFAGATKMQKAPTAWSVWGLLFCCGLCPWIIEEWVSKGTPMISLTLHVPKECFPLLLVSVHTWRPPRWLF